MCDSYAANLIDKGKIATAEMTITQINNEVTRLQAERLTSSQSTGATNDATSRIIGERVVIMWELQASIDSAFENAAYLRQLKAVLGTEKAERGKMDLLLQDSVDQRRCDSLKY